MESKGTEGSSLPIASKDADFDRIIIKHSWRAQIRGLEPEAILILLKAPVCRAQVSAVHAETQNRPEKDLLVRAGKADF